MARARRIIYNGNANNGVDYKPMISGSQRWAYVGGIRIPIWVTATTQPASAMTSNTAPSPYVCSYSSRYTSSYTGHLAFNKSYSNAYGWVADSSDTAPWITLKMAVALKDIKVTIYNRTRSSLVNGWKAFKVDGSDNGSTWTQIGSFSGRNGATSALGTTHTCTNYNDSYLYVRFRISDWERRTSSTDKYCAVGEIYINGAYAT